MPLDSAQDRAFYNTMYRPNLLGCKKMVRNIEELDNEAHNEWKLSAPPTPHPYEGYEDDNYIFYGRHPVGSNIKEDYNNYYLDALHIFQPKESPARFSEEQATHYHTMYEREKLHFAHTSVTKGHVSPTQVTNNTVTSEDINSTRIDTSVASLYNPTEMNADVFHPQANVEPSVHEGEVTDDSKNDMYEPDTARYDANTFDDMIPAESTIQSQLDVENTIVTLDDVERSRSVEDESLLNNINKTITKYGDAVSSDKLVNFNTTILSDIRENSFSRKVYGLFNNLTEDDRLLLFSDVTDDDKSNYVERRYFKFMQSLDDEEKNLFKMHLRDLLYRIENRKLQLRIKQAEESMQLYMKDASISTITINKEDEDSSDRTLKEIMERNKRLEVEQEMVQQVQQLSLLEREFLKPVPELNAQIPPQTPPAPVSVINKTK